MVGRKAGLNEVLLSALGCLRGGPSPSQGHKAGLCDLCLYRQTCNEHQEDIIVCVISVLIVL